MFQELNRDLKIFLKVPNARFAALGLFLIPFDSVRFFPMDTVYRPVWILPFFLIGFHNLFSKLKIDRNEVKLFIILVYMLFVTILLNIYFDYPDFSGLLKLLVICILLAFGVTGFNVFLRSFFLKHSNNEVLRVFSSVILYFSLFPILVGLIQIPGEIFGNFELNRKISSLFSYRYTPGRIHLVTGEPSWAARYILFVLIFSLFLKGRYITLIRIVLFGLLLFTGSTIGFLSGILLVILYLILSIKLRLSFLIKALAILFLVFYFFSNYEQILWFSPYAISKIEKVNLLISSLSFQTLMAVAAIDGSVLARFINPIIAFDLSLSYPLGIGGESFKFWILDMLLEYGYSGSSSDSYILGAGSTPKLFLAKILVEFGFLFTGVMTFYFLKIYFSLNDLKLKFLLFSIIIMTLSDDSYLFYGLIIPVSLTGIFSRNQYTI